MKKLNNGIKFCTLPQVDKICVFCGKVISKTPVFSRGRAYHAGCFENLERYIAQNPKEVANRACKTLQMRDVDPARKEVENDIFNNGGSLPGISNQKE